jgi:RNA polymerase sigma factor (sigma-70 family)
VQQYVGNASETGAKETERRRAAASAPCNNPPGYGNYYQPLAVMTSHPDASVGFPNTRWSLVLAAGNCESIDSSEALETICRAYWYPLYAYARRCGLAAHDAQDVTQAFFAELLEKRWLADAERERGRLRTFLIVALKNFMAKEWRRAAAKRRGGRATHLPLDTSFAESRFAAESGAGRGVDETYDRQWALTLLELALSRLQAEFERSGRAAEFEILKGCLMAARGAIDYEMIASQLQTSEGAARVAVHRLRKRFREVYREEIAQTVAEGADLQDELRHLAAALGGG